MEAGFRDVLTATQAFAIRAVRDARERVFDPKPFYPPTLSLRRRHGLALHGIHTAQPANAGLIEFHRRAIALILVRQLVQLGKPAGKCHEHLG